MKRIVALTIVSLSLLATPALAGGNGGGLRIGLDVATGKGGLVGGLLGGGRGGGLEVDLDVKTGKGGLIGALLGGKGGHSGGGGHGGCGCR